MPITEVQSTWINDFADLDVGSWEERQALRQRELESVRNKLKPIKIEIRAQLDITLKKMKGKKSTVDIPFLIGDKQANWNPEDEFDTVHDTGDLAEAVTADEMNRLMKAKDNLNLLSKQLEEATYNGTELFTAKEIREEYWKPLVREGICPDNLVDDLYNETVQVFQGANEYYEARQERDAAKYETSKVKDFQFLKDKAITVATSINEACGGPAIVGTALEATNVFIDATITIFEGVIEKDAESVLDGIGDILAQSLKSAGVDSTISGLVGSSFSTLSKGGLACEAFAKGDPKAAFAHIAGCIESAFETADGGNSDGPFTDIGKYIALGIESAIDVHTAVKCLQQDPVDMAGLLAVAESATQKAFKQGMARYVDSLDMSQEDKDELTENIDGIGDEDIPGPFAAAGKLSDRLDPEAMEEAKAKMLEQHNKNFQDELAKELDPENNEFENELDDILAAASMSPEEREALGIEKKHKNSIEKMIQKIEKARAALKIAEGIFDTGMKTAAEFFEPLQMGVAGKDFVKNMMIALKRAIELNQWIDQVEKAMAGASVYGAAFANRVKNLKIQITERTAHAMFAMLKVIGGALTVAGTAAFGGGALAGVIVSKAATAAEASFDAAMYLKKRVDAHQEWNKYKECLALGSQTDRKLMRSVLKGNPTLSKYAMAYGAVIEDDPIAKMGMRVCGIKEQHLQEDGSEVDLVVKYLETKFNDDPVLIKAQVSSDWQPTGDGEVKYSIWQANVKSAEKKTKFIPDKLGAIDGAFGVFEVARTEYETSLSPYETQRERFENAKAYIDKSKNALELAENALKEETVYFEDNLKLFTKLNTEAEANPQKQGDVDFRDEYSNTMQSLLEAQERREKHADDVEKRATRYQSDLRDYIQSDTNSFRHSLKAFVETRESFVTASRRLNSTFKKYSPKKTGDDGEEDDLVMRAHIKDVCMALDTLQAEAESIDKNADKLLEELQKLFAEQTELLGAIPQRGTAAKEKLKNPGLPIDASELKKRIEHWGLTDLEKQEKTQKMMEEEYYELGGDNSLYEELVEEWGKSEAKKEYDQKAQDYRENQHLLSELQAELQRVKGTELQNEVLKQIEGLPQEVAYLETEMVELRDKSFPDRKKLASKDVRWKLNELARLTKPV